MGAIPGTGGGGGASGGGANAGIGANAGASGAGANAGSGPTTSIGSPCAGRNDCPTGYVCLQNTCQFRCQVGRSDCPPGAECATTGLCIASGGGTGGAGGGGGTTGSPPPGPGYYGVPVTTTTPVAAPNACTNSSADASLGQLDILIVEDSTGSMGDKTAAGPTKWTMITDALTVFVNDPASAGIGAGIEFFSGDSGNACTVARYATPAVPIRPLNGNAAAIVAAIRAITPAGYTPTPAALEGALQYATAWLNTYPTHKVVIVLATDGLPNRYPNAAGTGCSGTGSGVDQTALDKTLAVAAKGVAGPPSIPTYVIGVMAPADRASLANLNQMAQYGGTGSAFIVDTAANAGKQFVAAMNAIREANKVACSMSIPAPPAGKWIDFSQVTVTYSTPGRAPAPLPWVASGANCPASGGFYYDNNTSPRAIQLCPSTCALVEADSAAAIQILFGCLIPSDAGPPPGAGGGIGTGGAAGSGGSTCLLDGQSCQTSAECCNGVCNSAGYCGAIIN
jgi:hypothetical protein